MNKLTLSILTIGLLSIQTFGQTLIDVAESTFKIKAKSEKEFYYGFAAGDQLIFNFEELNGKELKEIEIIEYSSTSKYMDYMTKKIENKTINITATGIYKFRFANSAIIGRICKIKIQRIPISETTKSFNSSVYWRSVQDTVYKPNKKNYLLKIDTIAKEIYSSSPQISSSNAINGNRNYQVLDFVLPENTISWSFYIGTGDKGKAEYEKAKTSFMQKTATAVSKIPGYGIMAALALTGMSYFNNVQGEDNVKYWFLDDVNSLTQFNSGQKFQSYKKGDVTNEASQMLSPLTGKVYLALLNDNIMEPISLTVKVSAIQVVHQWASDEKHIMKVSNKEEPYLKN